MNVRALSADNYRVWRKLKLDRRRSARYPLRRQYDGGVCVGIFEIWAARESLHGGYRAR